MKKMLLCALLTGLGACQLVDPTEVQNPNILEDRYLGSPGSAAAWQTGLARQLANTMSLVTAASESVSDNYFNNQTLANRAFDIPQILNVDVDVTNIAVEVGRLRATAEYGLAKVIPADARATAEQRAEFEFYRGMAHLLSGMLFVGIPAETSGAALEPDAQFRRAIVAFQAALAGSAAPLRQNAYRMALARCYYYLGDRPNAVELATQALAAGPSQTRYVTFDFANGVTNSLQSWLFRRAVGDFQPLPRLDFLDPKYSGNSPTFDDSLCVFKAEEAHLILAEALLAQGQLDAAKTRLNALLTLVAARPRRTFSDAGENRGPGGTRTDYPKTASIRVAASATDELRTGLVLDRKAGNITVPIVSGTSVTAAAIGALTTPEQALELLYLMRQEIFIAEGLRMTDLGIRFPSVEREFLNNPRVVERFRSARIPAFIPPNAGMDNFTFNAAAQTIVIQVNMNRTLVENRASDLVLPFH